MGMSRKTELRYYVFAARLDDALRTIRTIRERNPSVDPEKPVVYVGYRRGLTTIEAFTSGDFSSARNRRLREHAKGLLPVFGGKVRTRSMHRGKIGALAAQLETIDRLRAEGYAVVNPPERKTRRVYIIALDPAILDAKPGAISRTPSPDPEKPPIYVGETSKDPPVRLKEHQSNPELASKTIYGFALELCSNLGRNPEKMTHLEALREERNLAESLRRRGYIVYGGH